MALIFIKQMSSILSQLLDNIKFIKKVTDACKSYRINETAQAYDNLKKDGAIVIFDYSLDFTFVDIEHNPDGLIVLVTVKFTAFATIEFTNLEGITSENYPLSDCVVDVLITLPSDTIILNNIDDIAYKTEIKILNIRSEFNTENFINNLYFMPKQKLIEEFEKLNEANSNLKKQITELNNQVAQLNNRISDLGSSNYI